MMIRSVITVRAQITRKIRNLQRAFYNARCFLDLFCSAVLHGNANEYVGFRIDRKSKLCYNFLHKEKVYEKRKYSGNIHGGG